MLFIYITPTGHHSNTSCSKPSNLMLPLWSVTEKRSIRCHYNGTLRCPWSRIHVGSSGTQNQPEQCSAIYVYWSAALREPMNCVWIRLLAQEASVERNTMLMSIPRQELCRCSGGGTTRAARRLVVSLLLFVYVCAAFTSVELHWSYASKKMPPGPPSTSGWVGNARNVSVAQTRLNKFM